MSKRIALVTLLSLSGVATVLAGYWNSDQIKHHWIRLTAPAPVPPPPPAPIVLDPTPLPDAEALEALRAFLTAWVARDRAEMARWTIPAGMEHFNEWIVPATNLARYDTPYDVLAQIVLGYGHIPEGARIQVTPTENGDLFISVVGGPEDAHGMICGGHPSRLAVCKVQGCWRVVRVPSTEK